MGGVHAAWSEISTGMIVEQLLVLISADLTVAVDLKVFGPIVFWQPPPKFSWLVTSAVKRLTIPSS